MAEAIVLPNLSSFSSIKEDLVWCPVRMIRRFLKVTKGLRKETSQLFITHGGKHEAASKTTISRWIVEVIRMAYEHHQKPLLPGVRDHDVTGLAASWARFHGLSVKQILAAASWKTATTFAAFYMKDMTEQRGAFGRAVLQSKYKT